MQADIFDLRGSRIECLPERIREYGSLFPCRTPIGRLPEGIVHRTLDLRDTELSGLPRRLTAGDLLLNGKTIPALPDGIKIKGNLLLEGMRLRHVPGKHTFRAT